MRDIEKAKNTHLLPKIKHLIAIVSKNPFQNPPPYEKLRGYEHTHSRRINKQHRFVYMLQTEMKLLLRAVGILRIAPHTFIEKRLCLFQ